MSRVPSPPIHHLAAKGFDVAGDAYERGRPSYPTEAVELLCRELGIAPGKTAVDLAAGTGKLTAQLLPSGARLIAIEPVAGMRKRLFELMQDASGALEVMEGTAEAMPLGDGSVDAVLVAQAFHWFDGDAALREIHRVLAPRGALGLVWNVRDERVPWVAELTRLVDRGGADAPRHRSGAWRRAFETTTLFEPLQERTVDHAHEVDRADLAARVASISFVAAMPAPERERLLTDVRALVDADRETRGRERFAFPYQTHVYWTRAR
jgi:SAM-dependent methyltransferase